MARLPIQAQVQTAEISAVEGNALHGPRKAVQDAPNVTLAIYALLSSVILLKTECAMSRVRNVPVSTREVQVPTNRQKLTVLASPVTVHGIAVIAFAGKETTYREGRSRPVLNEAMAMSVMDVTGPDLSSASVTDHVPVWPR